MNRILAAVSSYFDRLIHGGRPPAGESAKIPKTPEGSYGATLALLASKLPRVATSLHAAEARRATQLSELLNGAHLKGANELLTKLDALAEAFEEDPALARLAFLVRRGVADFEVALEATISGYVAVAFDAMRDILDLENLLRDFANHPANVNEWLAADEQTLRKKFTPARVRERLYSAEGVDLARTPESVDYRGHSMALHVRPRHALIPEKGLRPGSGWDVDIGYWEMFEHARRLLLAIERVTGALSPSSDANRLACEEPAAVQEAWRRTQQMQAVFLALVRAANTSEAADDTEPA
jgi:hypothetical protein